MNFSNNNSKIQQKNKKNKKKIEKIELYKKKQENE